MDSVNGNDTGPAQNTTSESDPILRPAGLLERFHITRQLLGLDSCVICAAQYSSEYRLAPDILYRALWSVIRTHGALGVGLRNKDTSKNPVFVRLKRVDLGRVVHYAWTEARDLETILGAQFEEQFDATSDQPLWRLVILPDNTVIFAYHHGIGDGKSGISFHRALLFALTNPGPIRTPPRVVSLPASTEILPPIEAKTKLSPSLNKIFREIYDLFAPTSWTRGSSAWTGRNVPRNSTLKTNVKLIYFQPDDVTKFLETCRKHHATLTSAFFILSHSVLSGLISPSKLKTISSYIPISLRGIAGTSPDAFCDHVTAYHFYPPIQPDFSWTTASKLASQLKSQVAKSREEIGMLKFLFGNYESFFKGKLGSKRQGGLECSNLGRVDLNDTPKGDWSITRLIFAHSDVILGSALKVNMVGDPLGGLSVSVTWSDDAIETSLVGSFVVQLQERFDTVIETPSTLHEVQ